MRRRAEAPRPHGGRQVQEPGRHCASAQPPATTPPRDRSRRRGRGAPNREMLEPGWAARVASRRLLRPRFSAGRGGGPGSGRDQRRRARPPRPTRATRRSPPTSSPAGSSPSASRPSRPASCSLRPLAASSSPRRSQLDRHADPGRGRPAGPRQRRDGRPRDPRRPSRAARPAGTRACRICPEWVDAWIERGAERPPADRPSAP